MRVTELTGKHPYVCEASGCDQKADYEFNEWDYDADCMVYNWLCEEHAEPLLNSDPRSGEPI